MKQNSIGRRTFLKSSGAVSAGLFLGFYLPPTKQVSAATAQPHPKPNAFIRIMPDNTVTIILHKSEMGQGVYTALPMTIVEELEADWEKIRIESAPAHPDYYHTVWKHYQGTGTSSSVSSTWEQLRLAGATVREMLIAAAATTWSVSPKSCVAENSYVLHPDTQRRLSFGELAARAAQMPVPENVTLKKPSEFKLIGKSIKRLDTADKVKAKAVFGIDAKVPDMLIAVIARPPVFGSRLKHFDAKAAKAVVGVKDVVAIDMGVAVVADSFWSAKKGRDALKIEWEEGSNAELSCEDLQQKYAELAKHQGLIAKKLGEAPEALAASAKKLEAVYETPYLAHAPMEPLNCIADVRSHSCDIWTGTQMQTTDQQAACAITGLSPEQVRIHTLLLGGSFGRRANPHADFVKEAVQVSKAIAKPVKVIWTREDDIRGGYYRPMHYSKIAAGLDRQGNVTAWCHRLIGESIGKGTQFEGMLTHDRIDRLSVEGAADSPYAFPNQLIDHHGVDNGIPVLWWRGVGHSFTAFVIESFLDELAAEAKRDPVEFRLSMLEERSRHGITLKLAAQKAGWGRKLPANIYQGVALHKSFGSIVAQVAEVAVSDEGQVRVERVVCAIDCGMVVNPDIVRAQMESGIVYGLSSALSEKITFKNGRVEQSNFHDYPVLRLNEMPKIEVYLVQNSEKPSGVGEVATPAIAPAVGNAIFAATGKRVRRLPIR
jgi:isoquinoline 1-oxidoreductase beta subunit